MAERIEGEGVIRIVPDTSGFAAALSRQLKPAIAAAAEALGGLDAILDESSQRVTLMGEKFTVISDEIVTTAETALTFDTALESASIHVGEIAVGMTETADAATLTATAAQDVNFLPAVESLDLLLLGLEEAAVAAELVTLAPAASSARGLSTSTGNIGRNLEVATVAASELSAAMTFNPAIIEGIAAVETSLEAAAAAAELLNFGEASASAEALALSIASVSESLTVAATASEGLNFGVGVDSAATLLGTIETLREALIELRTWTAINFDAAVASARGLTTAIGKVAEGLQLISEEILGIDDELLELIGRIDPIVVGFESAAASAALIGEALLGVVESAEAVATSIGVIAEGFTAAAEAAGLINFEGLRDSIPGLANQILGLQGTVSALVGSINGVTFTKAIESAELFEESLGLIGLAIEDIVLGVAAMGEAFAALAGLIEPVVAGLDTAASAAHLVTEGVGEAAAATGTLGTETVGISGGFDAIVPVIESLVFALFDAVAAIEAMAAGMTTVERTTVRAAESTGALKTELKSVAGSAEGLVDVFVSLGRVITGTFEKAFASIQAVKGAMAGLGEEAAAVGAASAGASAAVAGEAAAAGGALDALTGRARVSAGPLGNIGVRLRGHSLFILAALGGSALALDKLAKSGVDAATSFETMQQGLEGVTGSAKASAEVLAKIKDFSFDTPFTTEELAPITNELLSIGIAAGNVIPVMKTIGDLVASTGGDATNFEAVSKALAKINEEGSLTEGTLNAISAALPGFDAKAAVAQQLGLSASQLGDALKDKTISSATGINALVAAMAKVPGAAGGMAKAAQTLTGVVKNFKEQIRQDLGEVFAPLVDTLRTSLTAALPAVRTLLVGMSEALIPFLQGIAGPIIGAIEGLSTALGPLFRGVLGVLQPVVELLLTFIGTILPPFLAAFGKILTAVAPIINVFADLAQVLAAALVPILDAFLPALDALAETGAIIANALGRSLGPIISSLADVIAGLLPTITTFATALGSVFSNLAVALAPIIVDVVRFFATLAEAAAPAIDILARSATALIFAFGPVVDAISEVVTAFGDAFGEILPIVAEVVGDIVTGLGTALLPIIRALTPVFGELADVIVAISPVFETIAGVIGEFAEALSNIIPFVTLFVAAIGQGLADALTALLPVIPSLAFAFASIAVAFGDLAIALLPLIPLLAQVVAIFVTDLGVPVIQALAGAVVTVANAFAGLVTTFAPLGDVAVSVVPAVQAFAEALIRLAPLLVSAIVPAIEALAGAVIALLPAFETVGSAVVEGFISILEGLAPALPAIAAAVGALADVFVSLVNAAAPLIPIIAEIVTALVEEVGVPVIEAIASAFTSLSDSVGGAGSAFAGPFATALHAIIDLIGAIGPTLTEIIGVIADNLGPVIESVLGIVTRLIPPIESTLESLLPAFVSFVEAIAPIVDAVGDLLVSVAEGLAEIAPNIGTFDDFGDFLNLIPALAKAFDNLLPVIIAVIDAGFHALDAIIVFLSDHVGVLTVLLGVFITAFAVGKIALFAIQVKKVYDGLVLLGGAVKSVGSGLGTAFTFAKDALTQTYNLIKHIVGNIITALRTRFAGPEIFGEIGPAAEGAATEAETALGGIGPAGEAAGAEAAAGLSVIGESAVEEGAILGEVFTEASAAIRTAVGEWIIEIEEFIEILQLVPGAFGEIAAAAEATSVAVVAAIGEMIAAIETFNTAAGLGSIGPAALGPAAAGGLAQVGPLVDADIIELEALDEVILTQVDPAFASIGVAAEEAALAGTTAMGELTTAAETAAAAISQAGTASGVAGAEGAAGGALGSVAPKLAGAGGIAGTGLGLSTTMTIGIAVVGTAFAASKVSNLLSGIETDIDRSMVRVKTKLEKGGKDALAAFSAAASDVGDKQSVGSVLQNAVSRPIQAPGFQSPFSNSFRLGGQGPIQAATDFQATFTDLLSTAGPEAAAKFISQLEKTNSTLDKSSDDFKQSEAQIKRWKDQLRGIGDGSESLFDQIKNMNQVKGLREIGGTLLDFFKGIPGALSSAAGAVGRFFGRLPGQIADVAQAIPGALSDFVGAVGDFITDIPGALGDLGGIIGDWIGTGLDALRSAPGDLLDAFTGVLTDVFDQIDATFFATLDLGSSLVGWITDGVEDLASAIPGLLSDIGDFFVDLPGNIVDALGDLAGLLTGWISSGLNFLLTSIPSVLDTIVDFFRDLPGDIVDALGDLGSLLVDAGSDLIGGFVDGLQSFGSGAVNVGKDIVNSMIGFINDHVIGNINQALDHAPVIGHLIGANLLPDIPHFARGDVVNQPTLGVFGEAGPEVIVPLSNRKRMIELLMQALSMGGSIPKFASGGIFGKSPLNQDEQDEQDRRDQRQFRVTDARVRALGDLAAQLARFPFEFTAKSSLPVDPGTFIKFWTLRHAQSPHGWYKIFRDNKTDRVEGVSSDEGGRDTPVLQLRDYSTYFSPLRGPKLRAIGYDLENVKPGLRAAARKIIPDIGQVGKPVAKATGGKLKDLKGRDSDVIDLRPSGQIDRLVNLARQLRDIPFSPGAAKAALSAYTDLKFRPNQPAKGVGSWYSGFNLIAVAASKAAPPLLLSDAENNTQDPSIGLPQLGDYLRRIGYQLPAFAYGDVVNRPTLGVFGEAGPEVILPLSNKKRMIELLVKAIGMGGSSTINNVTQSFGGLPAFAGGGIFRSEDKQRGGDPLANLIRILAGIAHVRLDNIDWNKTNPGQTLIHTKTTAQADRLGQAVESLGTVVEKIPSTIAPGTFSRRFVGADGIRYSISERAPGKAGRIPTTDQQFANFTKLIGSAAGIPSSHIHGLRFKGTGGKVYNDLEVSSANEAFRLVAAAQKQGATFTNFHGIPSFVGADGQTYLINNPESAFDNPFRKPVYDTLGPYAATAAGALRPSDGGDSFGSGGGVGGASTAGLSSSPNFDPDDPKERTEEELDEIRAAATKFAWALSPALADLSASAIDKDNYEQFELAFADDNIKARIEASPFMPDVSVNILRVYKVLDFLAAADDKIAKRLKGVGIDRYGGTDFSEITRVTRPKGQENDAPQPGEFAPQPGLNRTAGATPKPELYAEEPYLFQVAHKLWDLKTPFAANAFSFPSSFTDIISDGFTPVARYEAAGGRPIGYAPLEVGAPVLQFKDSSLFPVDDIMRTLLMLEKIGYAIDFTNGVPKFFAQGGIVDTPTFGVFGEAGPEVVVPLSNRPRMITLLTAALGGNEKDVMAAAAGRAMGGLPSVEVEGGPHVYDLVGPVGVGPTLDPVESELLHEDELREVLRLAANDESLRGRVLGLTAVQNALALLVKEDGAHHDSIVGPTMTGQMRLTESDVSSSVATIDRIRTEEQEPPTALIEAIVRSVIGEWAEVEPQPLIGELHVPVREVVNVEDSVTEAIRRGKKAAFLNGKRR